MNDDASLPLIAPPPIAPQQYPPSALYLVATPIGNLGDITLRALDCLKTVDAVAAEDTRVARRLLAHYGIAKPCFAAHGHNERAAGGAIVERLRAGERIAFVSDAGTPAISDPGALLVAAVRADGFRVVPIPGASALTTALSAAGLAQAPFYFHGFLPARRSQAEDVLKRVLKPLAALGAHLVFYEAPHRVADTVDLLAAVFGADRRIVIARELTKLFETVHSCRLGDAAAWLNDDANRLRGEFVLIVEGAIVEGDAVQRDALEAAQPVLARLMRSLPLSEAVDIAAELTDAPRKLLYKYALDLKNAR